MRINHAIKTDQWRSAVHTRAAPHLLCPSALVY